MLAAGHRRTAFHDQHLSLKSQEFSDGFSA
jgi:hypothetical protein